MIVHPKETIDFVLATANGFRAETAFILPVYQLAEIIREEGEDGSR